MSWDADLITTLDDKEVRVSDQSWNYTHNCNRMISDVLKKLGHDIQTHFLVGDVWWKSFGGRQAGDADELFDALIAGLEAEPERFRAMNPANGWGDYERLLVVLREMRAHGKEWPSATWRISG
jgi:hypothetical protein